MAIKQGSEDLEQINFINWFRHHFPEVVVIHIPNGGKRNMGEAMKLKRMGVMAGVPDLFIPAWGLWIEMKKEKGGKLSQEQKDMIGYLHECGYIVRVCQGFESAKNAVMECKDARVY